MRDYRKKSSLPMIVSLILSVMLAIILIYISYQKGLFKFPWEETNPNVADTTMEETVTFTGKTVITELPKGWNVQEYYNGEGSDYLVEGTTYTGLTGLKIFNSSNVSVFSLQAISGIGFEGCSEYYQFKDDSVEYKAEMQSIADEIGDTMKIRDLSNTTYVEFSILGTKVRRVDKDLYYDEKEGDNYFEASCFSPLLMLNGLYFTYEDNSKGTGYFYEYNSNDTNEELLQIDGILKSIKLGK